LSLSLSGTTLRAAAQFFAKQQLDLSRTIGDPKAEQRITSVNCRKIDNELSCQLIIKLTDDWAFEAHSMTLKWQ
jgi:hypothetical protein